MTVLPETMQRMKQLHEQMKQKSLLTSDRDLNDQSKTMEECYEESIREN